MLSSANLSVFRGIEVVLQSALLLPVHPPGLRTGPASTAPNRCPRSDANRTGETRFRSGWHRWDSSCFKSDRDHRKGKGLHEETCNAYRPKRPQPPAPSRRPETGRKECTATLGRLERRPKMIRRRHRKTRCCGRHMRRSACVPPWSKNQRERQDLHHLWPRYRTWTQSGSCRSWPVVCANNEKRTEYLGRRAAYAYSNVRYSRVLKVRPQRQIRGGRSRFLCISKRPNLVQPTRLVSTASLRKAAFNASSKTRRSFFGIGAGSRIT